VKLIQRIGLVFLPPRVAAWRYHMGRASLHITLGGQPQADEDRGLSGLDAADPVEDDADIDVAPEVEEVSPLG
jgi:hypothetical protein